MEKYYIANGIVRYKDDGWIVLECPLSIVNYYKYWIEKFTGKKISTSYHKPHVTILPAKHSGDFRKHKNWGKHKNEVVEFKYYSTIWFDKPYGKDRYFWLIVDCPVIGKIREEFGLNPNLRFDTHLTIGYLGY